MKRVIFAFKNSATFLFAMFALFGFVSTGAAKPFSDGSYACHSDGSKGGSVHKNEPAELR